MWLDALMSLTINTVILERADVYKIVLWGLGVTILLIYACRHVQQVPLLIILQENAWQIVPKMKEYMQICCCMSVLLLVQEVILAVRSIRLAFKFAIWVTMVTQLQLFVLIYVHQRYTLMGRM